MSATGGRVGLAVAVVLAAGATSRAWAFDPFGHDVIEAAAYRRLLETAAVPGAEVSGRDLLGALMAQGVLQPPPCFDAAPRGRCSAEALRDAPLRSWPPLGSGAADLLIDRQLDGHGQCQHFMAETADGLSPIDPRLGVPAALAATAYERCVSLLGAVLDGIVRHPRRASWRLAGMYALMHAIEDSFSAAHARRDRQGRIVHLLSWTLIDWPMYVRNGRLAFPRETHHAIKDDRDGGFLVEGGRAGGGQPCASFHHAYAVPDECLAPEARAAVAAVVDLLVLTHSLRHQAAAAGTLATARSPASVASWNAYVRKHLRSAAFERDVPPRPIDAPPRPDIFVGVLGAWTSSGWAASLWGGRLAYRPALPFVLGLFGGGGYRSDAGRPRLTGTLTLGFFLPLVRRLVIGFSPAGVQGTCTVDLDDCAATWQATVGSVIVRAGPVWLALQGPSYSWNARAFGDSRLAVAMGWWHERPPREVSTIERPPTWHPPARDGVRAHRLTRTTALAFLTATVAGTAADRAGGAGVEVLMDRDRWNRRAGLAPGLAAELTAGTVGGAKARVLGVAALARWYLSPDRIAVVIAPAALRVHLAGANARGAVDVGARAGVALAVGRMEVRTDAPMLSYLSPGQWRARPLSLSLALSL